MWGRPIRITRLAGFDIKIDASWLLIAGLITWSLSTGYFPQILPDAQNAVHVTAAIIAMVGLFLSLILHELAHSVMARLHGLNIAGITLFLFGGVAELETEPDDPTVEIRVAIVGPITSLALAGVFWLSMALAATLALAPVVTAVLAYLAIINLVLALFNLVPAFPLDGGRVFRAVIWRRCGDLLVATRRATDVSAYFAWGLIVLGLVAAFNAGLGAGLWPILVGLFLLAIGKASYRQAEMKQLFSGRCVADLMTRNVTTLRPDQTLADAVNHVFLAAGVSFAPVVAHDVLLGYVDLHTIRRIDRDHWATTIVEDVAESISADNSVAPNLSAQKLLEKISQSGRRKFLVVEAGVLRGVVTLSDVSKHLDISRQIASSLPGPA
ncbi:MAG: site-2 protease family protein [Rhodobacteraceae bacterium]|nr:site-2 protease family protein [Paracoccaceae bacterium]